MKTKSHLLIAVLLLAMFSLAVQSTGVGFGSTTEPEGIRETITLTRDAKTNGYVVIKLGDGIEVKCQGVFEPKVSGEKTQTGARLDGVTAEGKAQPGVPAPRSDGAGKYGTAEAGYEATAKAGATPEGKARLDPGINPTAGEGVSASTPGNAGKIESKPTTGEGISATATVQGTVEVQVEAVAEGGAMVSGFPPTVTVTQKVDFRDGNGSFKLCYTNVKSVTVIVDK